MRVVDSGNVTSKHDRINGLIRQLGKHFDLASRGDRCKLVVGFDAEHLPAAATHGNECSAVSTINLQKSTTSPGKLLRFIADSVSRQYAIEHRGKAWGGPRFTRWRPAAEAIGHSVKQSAILSADCSLGAA